MFRSGCDVGETKSVDKKTNQTDCVLQSASDQMLTVLLNAGFLTVINESRHSKLLLLYKESSSTNKITAPFFTTPFCNFLVLVLLHSSGFILLHLASISFV